MKISSLRGKMSVGIVLALVTVLAGTALALTSVSLILGTVAKYDFGGFGPGYPVPGRIQIQAFTMKPGDTVPWHYHKGVSYVILAHGNLTEQHQVGPHQCDTEQVTAGSAFVESAGQVHSVTNTGSNLAVIWWATIFPKSDKIIQFTPEFKSGGVYVVDPPACR
jgi:quercetin dioxygenase-like cupin family protein